MEKGEIMSSYLYDDKLSLKAKGCLTMLLADKNINSKQKIQELSKDGRESVNSAIVELKASGYLKIIQQRKGGLYDYKYLVFDYPKFYLNQPTQE